MSYETDLLRMAANRMRAAAESATPSPWGVANDTNIVRGLQVTGPGSYTCIQSVAEIDDDRTDWGWVEVVEVDPDDDALHIATFADPSVALAVADWLDLEARMAELRDNSAEGHTFHALTVARAYLREEVSA